MEGYMAKNHENIEYEGKEHPEEVVKSDIYDSLVKVLESHRGEKHIVVLQNYPDPDAIASGYAHWLISSLFDIDVDIVYAGKISHQENIAMVKLLDIELHHYDQTIDMNNYHGGVFVDNQGTSSEELTKALEDAGIPSLIVIDHHEIQDRLNPQFKDIRQSVGATSTIYTDYLIQGITSLDKSHKEHVIVSTALFHGIQTDTNSFLRAVAEDFQALKFLSEFRDIDMLEQIMSQSRSKQTMDVIHRALGERIIAENYSIAGIGFIRADDRDAIPQAADFLLTEDNVHTAIVYGIVLSDNHDEKVVGSIRTSKLTLDPDNFIKEAFGKNKSGTYSGGGRRSAGGFEIPIGFLSGGQVEEYQELKWQVFDNQIKQIIFAKIGIDNKPGEF
jgi:nanoRNase/pAp phosphatase (c-di-AMP/oligoRNAs hydrolase)